MGMTLNPKDLLKNRSSIQVPLVAGSFLEREDPSVEVLPSLLLREEFRGRRPGGEDRATPGGG
jgi:hypothetical protein